MRRHCVLVQLSKLSTKTGDRKLEDIECIEKNQDQQIIAFLVDHESGQSTQQELNISHQNVEPMLASLLVLKVMESSFRFLSYTSEEQIIMT